MRRIVKVFLKNPVDFVRVWLSTTHRAKLRLKSPNIMVPSYGNGPDPDRNAFCITTVAA